MSHSPLPWNKGRTNTIVDANGILTVEIGSNADRDFILNAVNGHDQMRGAILNLIDALDNGRDERAAILTARHVLSTYDFSKA